MRGLAVCHGASQGVNNGQRLRREGVAEAAAIILPATADALAVGLAACGEGSAADPLAGHGTVPWLTLR